MNNTLGGWSIENEMVNFINKNFLSGKSILEFGSGEGTKVLLENYNVTSIEHDPNYFIKRRKHHRIFLAPITGYWYSKTIVKSILKENYDLFVVDGPPLNLRIGILDNLDSFKNIATPIIFDDIDRKLDKNIMRIFCKKLGYKYEIIEGNKKKFAFCKKPKLLVKRTISA